MSTGGPLVVYWQPFLLSGVECLRRSDLVTLVRATHLFEKISPLTHLYSLTCNLFILIV